MESENSFRSCSICGSVKVVLISPATAFPTSSKQVQVTEKYFGLHGDLVRCRVCGFTYVGQEADAEKIVGLYKNMSDEVYRQEEKERRRSFLAVISEIERLRKGKKGKILDIGCCTGGLLAEAQNMGWDVVGVDPSNWACTVAKKLHNLSIYNGTIEDYRGKPASYDVVTILDVLEHVIDPKKLLEKVHTLLKKDGIFCIVTPDFGSFTAKLLGKRWWGIRLGHLSYFRKKDLDRIIDESGFEVIKSKPYIRYFSLYYIFVRLFPAIENFGPIRELIKKIIVPLVFFDTFELYLQKASS